MNLKEKENILNLLSEFKSLVAFTTEDDKYLNTEIEAIINAVNNVSTNETEIAKLQKEIERLEEEALSFSDLST